MNGFVNRLRIYWIVLSTKSFQMPRVYLCFHVGRVYSVMGETFSDIHFSGGKVGKP